MTDTEPWADLITRDRIVALHATGLSRYGGGAASPAKQGCVESSLGAAWSAELYREDDGVTKGLCFAGYLLYYLAKNHCFTDGNKRVAWLATMQVLLAHGLTVNATTPEAEELINGLIEGRLQSADAVIVWLGERLTAVQ